MNKSFIDPRYFSSPDYLCGSCLEISTYQIILYINHIKAKGYEDSSSPRWPINSMLYEIRFLLSLPFAFFIIELIGLTTLPIEFTMGSTGIFFHSRSRSRCPHFVKFYGVLRLHRHFSSSIWYDYQTEKTVEAVKFSGAFVRSLSVTLFGEFQVAPIAPIYVAHLSCVF